MDKERTECDKLLDVKEESMTLSSFVEWLNSKNIAICTVEKTDGYPREQWLPIRKSYEELFADYFEIDLKKLEQEKQEILRNIRGYSSTR